MSDSTGLLAKRCVACEGGVPTLTEAEVATLLVDVPEWRVVGEGKRIRREWKTRNFVAAVRIIDQVAAIAEDEGHHPDLHLERYNRLAIEVWIHAIGGLSENDFILAAKIDRVADGPGPALG